MSLSVGSRAVVGERIASDGMANWAAEDEVLESGTIFDGAGLIIVVGEVARLATSYALGDQTPQQPQPAPLQPARTSPDLPYHLFAQ